ncbi:MAG: nuclear transport factor 2 family protein [Balneolales bacterium]|nr:nuclear transport factor 2 family protein [Balneolales bacterium]
MKKHVFLFSIITVLVAFTINATKLFLAEEEIKETILTGYVHGAFNELNPEAMKKTFHEEFAIFSTDGENLRRYPIANWVESVDRRKNSSGFNPEENIWEPKFLSIDVSGNSASVKLELHHEGELVYTDYLSLLKFNDGWKIVAKVYYQHN